MNPFGFIGFHVFRMYLKSGKLVTRGSNGFFDAVGGIDVFLKCDIGESSRFSGVPLSFGNLTLGSFLMYSLAG